jgi:hypothetical protein
MMFKKIKNSPIFDTMIFIATFSNILLILYTLEIIGSNKLEIYNKILIILANILIQLGILKTPNKKP